jgi:hypothetical protein
LPHILNSFQAVWQEHGQFVASHLPVCVSIPQANTGICSSSEITQTVWRSNYSCDRTFMGSSILFVVVPDGISMRAYPVPKTGLRQKKSFRHTLPPPPLGTPGGGRGEVLPAAIFENKVCCMQKKTLEIIWFPLLTRKSYWHQAT